MTATLPKTPVARAYWTEAKFETVRMLRSPGFAIPFLGLPVGLYLLFAVLLYGDAVKKDPAMAAFMFLGFSVFGAMGPGMFGFGVSLALEREQGLFRLKRAVPAPAAAWLVAKMAMAVLFVAIIMATMLAAAPLGHLQLPLGRVVAFTVVTIAGALPFCAIGLWVGSWASGKSAPAFVNLFYLPMIYLSGFLIPMPKSMLWLERLSPGYYLDQLALWSVGGPRTASVAASVAVLAGLTIGLTALALRRLKRVG
jgi:ABC-2 type transport system permease protein